MGCITAATAALGSDLAPEETTLVLVAPALPPPQQRNKRKNSRIVGQSATMVADEEERLVAHRARDRRSLGTALLNALLWVPTKLFKAVGSIVTWLFNWCVLPLFYPAEVLALR